MTKITLGLYSDTITLGGSIALRNTGAQVSNDEVCSLSLSRQVNMR